MRFFWGIFDGSQVTNYLVYLAEPPSCHGSDATAAVAGPYTLNVEDTKGGWCRQRYAINELLGCKGKITRKTKVPKNHQDVIFFGKMWSFAE